MLVEPDLGSDSEGAEVKSKERKKVLRGLKSSPSPSPSKSAEVDEETLALYAHDSDESFIELETLCSWPGQERLPAGHMQSQLVSMTMKQMKMVCLKCIFILST